MTHAAALTAAPTAGGPLDTVERVLGFAVEACACVLVVAETIILLMGVVSRFVFDRPLVWSDEIASLLFLWLAMIGAAMALRRGTHMRLSTLTAAAESEPRICAGSGVH